MKFNHLNVPTHWQSYWTRFPEGHTILEALISWVSQVDDMVDNVNNWNEYLDNFVATFDKELQQTVTTTLSDWQTSGFLDVVISEALQWQLDDYIATNEQDKLSITAQLQQTEQELSSQLVKVEQLETNNGDLLESPPNSLVVDEKHYYSNNMLKIPLTSAVPAVKDGSISRLDISTTNQVLINAQENSKDIKVMNSKLESENQTVTINAKNVHDYDIIGNDIIGGNFPVLINQGSNGGSNANIINNNIESTKSGDGVEINTISNSDDVFRGTKVIGNTIYTPDDSVTTTTGRGFGIGMAQGQDVIVIGNYVKESRMEGLHIEDSSENVVVTGNVFNNMINNGCTLTGTAQGRKQHTVHVITNNHFKKKGNTKTNYGIHVATTSATQTMDTVNLSNNRIEGFDRGLMSDTGRQTILADGLIIENCNVGVSVSGTIKGTIVMKNTPKLVAVGSVYAELDNIVSTTPTEPDFIEVNNFRVSLKQFKFPTPRLVIPTGYKNHNLFQEPKYMDGQLTLVGSNTYYVYTIKKAGSEFTFEKNAVQTPPNFGNLDLELVDGYITLKTYNAGTSGTFIEPRISFTGLAVF